MRQRKLRMIAGGLALVLTSVAHAATLLRDDFLGGNSGWAATTGGGTNAVEFSNAGEYLYLHNGGDDNRQFPLAGRNDAFNSVSPYWRLSMRFRFIDHEPFGTTIAAGTASFDANNRGGGVRPTWEDILRLHHYGSNFQAGAYGTVHYTSGATSAWHTVELDVSGSSYIFRLDGVDRGSGTASGVPRSLWFGNYSIQGWNGPWTDIQVDWVEVSSDLEAPATTATASGTPGNAGWWRSDVSVSLAASDAWSGVAATSYRIDGGAWTPYSGPFTVSGEGLHTVEYRSSDNAGNTEGVQSLAVAIDPTPPATSATPAGSVGCAGWYTSTVQMTLAASDATSGVALTQYQLNGGGWQPYALPLALGDGNHTLEYYATDAAGNPETASSLSLRIDTTPPATTSSLSGTAGDNGWWRSNVGVTFLASDAMSGLDQTLYRVDSGVWQTYASEFNVSGEGMHTLEYYSTDVACNAGIMATEQVQIDTVPPASSMASLSDGRWISGTVRIAGTASDATSGVALVDYSTDGGSSWQAASGTANWSGTWDTTGGPDGDYDVCTRSRDVAGNVEPVSCITVHVDNTAPATAASRNGTAGCNGWYRLAVDVLLSASDGSGVGVSSTRYRMDGGAWQAYSSPLTVSGEGLHTVEYTSTDGLGNVEVVQTLAVNIDGVAPATSATPAGTLGGGGWYISSVQVALSASDATSGVGFTEYRIDGGGWQAYGGPFAVSGDGARTVEYRSQDNACNTEMAGSLAVNIDSLEPATTLDLDGTAGNAGWWRSAVTATLSASDATSGVALTEYDLDGGGWTPYSAPFSISGEGHHDLDYRSTDVAGNREPALAAQIRIDTVAPSTTAASAGPLGLNGWYTGTVSVALSASDATSGVDATYLGGVAYSAPVTTTSDGRYSVPYYSQDVAGNPETPQAVVFNLDTTPPDAGVIGGRFCPRCGQTVMIQPDAVDATSGLSAWRLELLDGATVVVSWTGTTVPASIPWDGRDATGERVPDGTYSLRQWVRDMAGWERTATGQVIVQPRPPSPPPPPPAPTATPPPTPTPWPTWTGTPTELPTVTPTPWPGETPVPPTATPLPTAVPPTSTPEAVGAAAPAVALRVGVFEDSDEDATRDDRVERALEGLEVTVDGGAWWNATWAADAQGVVTITLPGPGVYKVSLLTRPSVGNWAATTRLAMTVQVEADRSVVIWPVEGDETLPVGTAPGCGFAFGLVPRAVRTVTIWLPLAAIALLVLTTLGAVLDRRAKAIRGLEKAMGGAR
jgi:hypothetical protein